jgi:hypothetical protein
VCDLLNQPQYSAGQMTYDLRRLRMRGLIYRPAGTNRYLVTPHGWKVGRLFSRLEARVFRPAMAAFTSPDAVYPARLRTAVQNVDRQLDELIYEAVPFTRSTMNFLTLFFRS